MRAPGMEKLDGLGSFTALFFPGRAQNNSLLQAKLSPVEPETTSDVCATLFFMAASKSSTF